MGSSLIGSLLIFFGFDGLASKIAAGLIAFLLLLVLIWAKNWFARGMTLLFIAVIVALYFIPGNWAIRYFVLFVGCATSSVTPLLSQGWCFEWLPCRPASFQHRGVEVRFTMMVLKQVLIISNDTKVCMQKPDGQK